MNPRAAATCSLIFSPSLSSLLCYAQNCNKFVAPSLFSLLHMNPGAAAAYGLVFLPLSLLSFAVHGTTTNLWPRLSLCASLLPRHTRSRHNVYPHFFSCASHCTTPGAATPCGPDSLWPHPFVAPFCSLSRLP
ncbi:hypothetical protein AMTR_s00097p00111930 [Amborella trichopoda]|uniref:Uncharacterized protein n=1 Tax=Amborella trichopoda TaxID=13333 RepID=W1P463_AMBTC|nr:hypothetical protein AMTR_s00097p00111930 [Amborella trichopoda]